MSRGPGATPAIRFRAVHYIGPIPGELACLLARPPVLPIGAAMRDQACFPRRRETMRRIARQ